MKIIFVQNIMTPYRISFFNSYHGVDENFKVYYMAKSEEGRSWKIDTDKIKYSYKVYDGFQKRFGSYHLHFNIKMLKDICSSPSILILGGSWNDINIIIISILKRLGILRKHKVFFWTEANMLTLGSLKTNFLKKSIRKFVLGSSDGNFIVPGAMAIKTLKHWEIPIANIIYLPNVIEEEKFFPAPERQINFNSGNCNGLANVILPARLIEKYKGIKNFFDSIGIDNIKRARFHILGDGDDFDLYERYIKNNHLGANIILHGFCNEKLSEFYSKADFFLLPSFSDQSPLVIVEACYNGLPLLISNRCGNHFETLEEEINGFSFDPYDNKSIKIAFEKMMDRRKDWREMGKNSRKKYDDFFDKNTATQRFYKQLQDLN